MNIINVYVTQSTLNQRMSGSIENHMPRLMSSYIVSLAYAYIVLYAVTVTYRYIELQCSDLIFLDMSSNVTLWSHMHVYHVYSYMIPGSSN